MVAASRFKQLYSLYTNSLKLIGIRRHVTVHAQKRPKLGRHRSCPSIYISRNFTWRSDRSRTELRRFLDSLCSVLARLQRRLCQILTVYLKREDGCESSTWNIMQECCPPLPYNLPKTDFESILPSTPRSSEWSLSFGLSHQKLVNFSVLSHARHMSRSPRSPWFDLPYDTWEQH
jgi:hypothetical protein